MRPLLLCLAVLAVVACGGERRRGGAEPGDAPAAARPAGDEPAAPPAPEERRPPGGRPAGTTATEDAEGADATASRPLRVGGDVEPPKRIVGPHPDLSACGRPKHIVILVQGVVGLDGRFRDLEFLKESPGECFEDRLRETLSRWRFEPAELDGEPVEVIYTLSLPFHPR